MNLGKALGSGGWLIAAVMGLSGLLAGDAVDPVERIANAPASSPCPSGWTDTSSDDEHARVLSCQRGPWLVVLTPDGAFERGLREGADDFETDPSKVEGWQ